jgi:hypothetical protein
VWHILDGLLALHRHEDDLHGTPVDLTRMAHNPKANRFDAHRRLNTQAARLLCMEMRAPGTT